MVLNSIGRIVRNEWERSTEIRLGIKLDVYQIMPDHLHAIIEISGDRWGVSQYAPNGERDRFRSPGDNLGAIIRGFKSAGTRKINIARGTPGAPVWQRNYWDRILRRRELPGIREYIRNNPNNYNLK
jgi:REP element-mobilizing transposase RayT